MEQSEDVKNVFKPENDYKDFYKEYTHFLNQKNTLIHSFKENLKLIENIRFENLENSLSKRFPLKIETHKCDICNMRVFRNFKALSTHKRKCIKMKTILEDNETEISEPDDEEENLDVKE
jgi:hypothetical protein